MASIGFLIGGALVNALAFTGSNYLFSSLSKESIDKEQKGTIRLLKTCNRLNYFGKKKDNNVSII